MINFILALDNEDHRLGSYFIDTTELLVDIIEENNPKQIIKLETVNCNTANINSEVAKLNGQPFVFVGNCHGNEDSLICQTIAFISKDVNDHIFRNSLFIANSCSVGKYLGVSLNEKGCKVFLGFSKTIEAFLDANYKKISISCDNYFLLKFLRDDLTVSEAFQLLKQHYDWQIDRLTDVKDILFAADLVDIKESLVFLMNEDIKKEDLYVE